MARYYAIVEDDYIQFDLNTGQLEIYETMEQAKINCPSSCNVKKKIRVKKDKVYVGLPVDSTKPDWFESDDDSPFDDPGYERTYFDT